MSFLRLQILFLILFFLSVMSSPLLTWAQEVSADTKKSEVSSAKKTSKKEKKKKKDKKKKKKKKLTWSGNFKVAFRYVKTKARSRDSQFGFELQAVNLKMKYRMKRWATFRLHYRMEPDESKLRAAFVEMHRPEDFFDLVKLGLQPRLLRLDSDLETDSLNKIAFYEERDVGVLSRVQFTQRWSWWLGFFNGLRLDGEDISPRRTEGQDIILSDESEDDQFFSPNSRRELNLGLGYDLKLGKKHSLKILSFILIAGLSDEDVDSLDTLSDLPGLTGSSIVGTTYENRKVGVNVEWESKQWRSYTQYVVHTIRDLERHLLSTELGYRWGDWQPILAYSEQRLDIEPDSTLPLSWSRFRYTLGSHHRWNKHTRFSIEFTVNEEHTGGGEVHNDEAIFSWRYSFS